MSRKKSASDLSPAELEKQIQSGKVEPLYLFIGEDSFLKDGALKKLVNTVDEGFRDFNVEEFSLQETPVAKILDAARQLPMLARHRLLIISDVDKLKDETGTDALIEYLRHPVDTTCMVFVTNTLDGRRRYASTLQKTATVISFDHLDDKGAEAWANRYLKSQGVTIDPQACGILIGLTGGNLAHLKNALEKLITYVGKAKRITPEDVKALVPRTRETNSFDLGDAMLANDRKKAIRLLHRMIDDGGEPVAIVGLLAWSYRTALVAKELIQRDAPMSEVAREARVAPYKKHFFESVNRLTIEKILFAVKRLAQVDLAIKTSQGTPALQLEHLICELTSPTSFK
ncbi:MAG TPA: DNA polymerase III subunit delta [Blastocatellia bacterium]|nr:DNA polymerase III subunit delta [Blastocatellia bacterium]